MRLLRLLRLLMRIRLVHAIRLAGAARRTGSMLGMENNSNPQLDGQLDSEYRAFVRSLHGQAMTAIVELERWWRPDAYRIVALGGYEGEGRDSQEVAAALEKHWRQVVEPSLQFLVFGHPDPDVRLTADVLVQRTWSVIMIMTGARGAGPMGGDEMSVAIHLFHDGVARLRRAVYHAPFRVERPEPQFEGHVVGNREPLPERFLEMIRELQQSGAIEIDESAGAAGLADAVRQLSSVFFLPAEERAAMFAENQVEDPAAEQSDADAEDGEFRFGFSV